MPAELVLSSVSTAPQLSRARDRTREVWLEISQLDRFETLVLPHLKDAYTRARWLMRNDADAEDATQESMLRALRHFDGFRGGDARAWLLAIVRNTCHTWHRDRTGEAQAVVFDEELHSEAVAEAQPETDLILAADREDVRRALDALPAEFREVVVLRELEGLSYQEIAAVAEVPIGTVMSRLARARKRLAQALGTPRTKGGR